MSTPGIRGFQLDGSAIGNAAKSVNLYRGDVNLPLKLIDLKGPDGLDLSLAGYYSSNVGQQWDTWNLEAPTGVLGLGWSLPFSNIAFSGRGTASWLEGGFTLHIGGNAHPLVLLSYSGSAADGDEALCLADPLNPLWTFDYTPSTETWVVVRDDGVIMTFGDDACGRQTVQWGVRWDNWAGNSSSEDGNPQRFASAWNLSTMSDPWGRSITYTYLNDAQPVTASLDYTRACYLDRIVDAYGRTIILSYGDKDLLEYQAPHTIDGQTPGAGYQDRYETRYLSRIDVYSPAGTEDANLYYSLLPSYQLHDPENSQLTTTCKRYLVSLAQQRGGIDLQPAMGFTYQLDPNQPGPGRLSQLAYPSGGTVGWSYADIDLADPEQSDNIFNLSYTAVRPADSTYADATPRLWFGSDYVIVAWYAGESLALRVYSYGGRWSEPYCCQLDGVNPQLPAGSGSTDADKLQQVRIAMGPDFFVLHYHNQGNGSDTPRIFQKAIDQFGLWTPTKYDCGLGSTTVVPEETALVAGNDFAALHVGGSGQLFRFRYSPVTRAWTADDPVSHNSNAPHIALAAQNNTLAACYFADSGSSVRGESVIYYLKGDYTWGEYSQFDATDSFAWDAGYVDNYWGLGPGYAVGTCQTQSGSSNTAHLQFIHWQRNFAGFSLSTKTIDGGSPTTLVGANAVCNAGTLLRYNGAGWVEGNLGWEASDLLAATDDTVLRVRRQGSFYNENELATFDAQNDTWSTQGFENDNSLPSYAYPSGPQFSGSFLTLSNRAFYRGTDNDWQPVPSLAQLPHCYGSTVANLGPGFIAWQNADNRSNPDPDSLAAYAALPKNGDLPVVSDPYSGQKVQSLDGATLLCGANAFATYDAEVSEFSHVGQFTLHRVLNHELSKQTATAVVELTIDTGVQTLKTRYHYQTDSAVFDPSGTVVQFPQVTSTRVSALDGTDLGKTVYDYYNGQTPDAALAAVAGNGETCLAGCGDDTAFCAHYSLANGYLTTVTEYGSDGTEVARMVNSWTPVTFDATFTPLRQRSVLRSASVTHQFPGLAVTNLDGTPDGGGTATLRRAQVYTYDTATARISANTYTQYNSRGVQETRKVAYTFAWSQYPGMKAARRLTAPCMALLSTTVGTTETPVQALAQTFGNDWGTAGEVWDHRQSWSWLGAGEPSFDFTLDDHDGWSCESTVAGRNALGFKTLTRDALDTPTSTLFDASGLWPIAKLVNTDNGLYYGFEAYEDGSDWRLSGAAQVQAGDAHSGGRCLHLPAGGGLNNTAPVLDSGRWVFSCRVKSLGDSDAEWTLTVGADSTPLAVPSSADWQYLFRYLDVTEDGSAVALDLTNTGSGILLLDEVRLTPLLCRFSARVYDADSWYPLAKLGDNGETTRSFYDDRLRVVAGSGPDENVDAIQSLYYTDAGLGMFTAQPVKPNSSLKVKAASGGPWDDFRDSDWSGRWSGAAAAWLVVDRALTHQGSNRDAVTLNGSDQYCNVAVQVRVSAEQVSGDLGITLGASLEVQWNHSAREWRMLVGGLVVDSAAGGLQTPMHWLLISVASGVVFCLNDEPLLSYAQGDNIGGSLGLYATDAGVGFSQVLVALDPITHVSYLDGTHQAVQGQQLADDQIIVQQTLFDELGRATIHTKPAIYDATVLGYQAGFVTGLDYADGVMTGAVADYYSGQDGRSDDAGYPYTRSSIEDSALARPLARGIPGKAYAIGAANGRPSQFQYGVNGSSVLYAGDAEQQYKLGLSIDPEGNTIAALTDLLGNPLGQVRGGPGLPPGSLVSACLRDAADNPEQIHPPNWFAPPSGIAEDWSEDQGFDYHNRPLSHAGSDEGSTDSVRDRQGRLRFKLIADGAAVDPANPCQGEGVTPVAILYSKYDGLGRIVEQGRYCVAAWDDVAQHADDQDWPQDAGDWRYRHSYDGDGSQPYCIGRATEMQTNNGATVAVETYQYDIRGKVVGYCVDDGSDTPLTIGYTHDCLGRPTRVDYPAMGSLQAQSVVYAYNTRGLLASIGDDGDAGRYATYSYNATGQIETVLLGGGGSDPITRSYTYTAAGRPRSITDTGSTGVVSTETLYYEQSNSDGSNTPRYDGLLSALDYSRTADGAEYRWTYAYDPHGRLTRATLAGGETRGYSYDGNGNITEMVVGGDTTSFSYNGSNLLQSAGGKVYSSAPSGEVTAAGNQGFEVDFNTRLTTVITDGDSGSSVRLRYGSGAQRLRKEVQDAGGKTTAWRRYLPGPKQHSLQEQVWDADSGTTTEVRYIHGPHGILVVRSGGADYFLLHDHERSPRLLLSGAGAPPTALFDYLPFGAELHGGGSAPDLLNYRYTGQEWDAETGLYNFRHRLYDPAIARFYAPDPERQYFSPYIYVGDHPLLLTDPSGEFGIGNIGGIIQSSEQIAAGGLLVGIGAAVGSTTVMAAGGALIGGGAMTMDYSIQAKHFSEGKFLQVDAAATIATAEFEAGVLISGESGGIGYAIGGGALTGAGGAGYADVFKQVNSNPDAKFDWGEWGIAEGTGAITGAVAGGVGYGIGSALGVMGSEAAEAGGGEGVVESEAGEEGDGLPRRKLAMDETEDNGFDYKRYAGRIFAKTTGRFFGGMAGETFNYGMTAWYNGTKVNAGHWALDSLEVGGEQAATQFATGLVFEAYTPGSDSGKAAYAIGKRAVRSGIGLGWSYLIKLH